MCRWMGVFVCNGAVVADIISLPSIWNIKQARIDLEGEKDDFSQP